MLTPKVWWPEAKRQQQMELALLLEKLVTTLWESNKRIRERKCRSRYSMFDFRNERFAIQLNFSQPPKLLDDFKNVKSKVDSYWKNNVVPTAKRTNSQLSPPKLVTTKAVRFAKAEVPQLVNIKPPGMPMQCKDRRIPF